MKREGSRGRGRGCGKLQLFWSVCLMLVLLVTSACSTETTAPSKDQESKETEKPMTGKLQLDKSSGRIGDKVMLSAEGLNPNEALSVIWGDMVGSYMIEDNYSYIGTSYEPQNKELVKGTSDSAGKWSGEIVIPDGFGDDHNVLIFQGEQKVAQANFFVETVFSIYPESGPIGTEITIIGEGLSWKMYGSLWHLTYDNKYTGMLTGVTTNGKATGKIRAAGGIGSHTLTIEGGSSGSPYLNRAQSAVNYIHTQYFTFHVTDDQPTGPLMYVEEPPQPAGGGIKLPDPVNKPGVSITLDKSLGIVGEKVVMNGRGLPPNGQVQFDWHTMVGNRVSTQGFGEEIRGLGEAKTDAQGEFTYEFAIPDDLGGLPHLIEVKVKDEVFGQTYLRILPSIVEITPSSGPVGTEFIVVIKGSGWTEYDNSLAVTYDNASIGYICGFNSQGTIKLPLIASGEPGYHVVDIYPAIYKGQQIQPNMYLNPQLTYLYDHPGTGIPALRSFFQITE